MIRRLLFKTLLRITVSDNFLREKLILANMLSDRVREYRSVISAKKVKRSKANKAARRMFQAANAYRSCVKT